MLNAQQKRTIAERIAARVQEVRIYTGITVQDLSNYLVGKPGWPGKFESIRTYLQRKLENSELYMQLGDVKMHASSNKTDKDKHEQRIADYLAVLRSTHKANYILEGILDLDPDFTNRTSTVKPYPAF